MSDHGLSLPGMLLHDLPLPDVWLWLGLYFAIGLVGTWLARGYSLRNRLIDQPGERRSHDTPTPRGGGIAIVAALLLALAWLAVADASRLPLYVAIAAGLTLVAGVGWLDDHKPLSARLRLATHAVAAMILAWGVHGAGGGNSAAACAFVFALVLVNIWNFMDGIDGIAASQAILVSGGYALLAGSGPAAWLALAMAAACMGFLPFNLPRARIFLGDVGSGAIGYVIAALAAVLVASNINRAPVLLLPLSAFVIDATLTLGTRMVRRERWWQPHTRHAYQRWARSWGRHDVTTWAYACWTTIAVLVMLMVSNLAQAVIMAVLGATYLVGAVAWWRLQRMADMLETGVRE